jgi:diguanylate cyclase (GGDEF)-like protein
MTLAIAIAASLLSFAAMAFMARARAAVADAEARAAAAEAARHEADRLAARVRALQREVEVLSAIREVALIANDDVSFERILGEVLKIVEDLVGAEGVALHLVDEQGRLAPQGAADAELGPVIEEAYRLKRTMRRAEGARISIATLMYADAEVAGVLAARAQGGGGDDAGEIEHALEALAKHVALAMKKPALYDKAVIDGLTRLFTKRHFTSQLARQVAQSRRTGAPFALVIADVDHFKRVNDTHGHVTGDVVLAEVAATVAATIRESDEAFRYGGEEMVVIAPDADAAAGRALAERLRAAIESRALRTARGEPLRVTASFGVAAFAPPGATAPAAAAPAFAPADPQALVAAADKALYAAKAGGRNRVCAHGDPAPPAAAPPAAAPPAAASAPKRRAAARATTK